MKDTIFSIQNATLDWAINYWPSELTVRFEIFNFLDKDLPLLMAIEYERLVIIYALPTMKDVPLSVPNSASIGVTD